MIRVGVLDDHPAVLAGLRNLIETTTDLEPVVTADSADGLWRQLDAARADVVILDYDLGRSDGLALCQRVKQRVRPPGVVIYSAYGGPRLELATRIAGADALIDKRAPASELLDTVRRAATGEPLIADLPSELLQSAIGRLESRDVPVASMLLASTSHQDIADILATDRRDIRCRIRRIVGRLRPKTEPETAAGVAQTRAVSGP